MSPNIKAPSIDELVQQLADVRQALAEERARLVDRIATIDQALGVTGAAKPSKASKAAPKARSGGIREAITTLLASRPNLTIKAIQEALPEYSPSSVEATVRVMAAGGQLSKDDSSPKKFSLPATAGKQNGTHKSNGASATA